MNNIARFLTLFFLLLIFGCMAAIGHAADPPRAFGLQFTKHGVKAAQVQSHPKFAAAPLPASDTALESYFYFTNQGSIGSCGPSTTQECIDALVQRDTRQHCVISRLDVYQRTLQAQGQFPQDAGVNNSTMLLVIKNGALLESTWPYVPSKLGKLPKESAQTQTERSTHAVIKGYTVPTNDNGYAARQCIHNLRCPIVVGRLWYNSQFTVAAKRCTTKDANGKSITVTRWVIASARGSVAGGHDIAGIAYDDNMIFPDGSKGGFEIHNHWAADQAGTQPWGDSRGSAWMPYKDAFSSRQNDDWLCFETTNITAPAKP